MASGPKNDRKLLRCALNACDVLRVTKLDCLAQLSHFDRKYITVSIH
jgi:hypothetical protein